MRGWSSKEKLNVTLNLKQCLPNKPVVGVDQEKPRFAIKNKVSKTIHVIMAC